MNDPSLLQTDLLLPALVVLSLVLQLRAGVRLRSPFINWKRVLAAVVVGLVAALPSTARPVAMAQTVPVTSVDVSLTDAGLQPPSVTLASGGSIHWTNSSSQTQAIVADDGLFDSGNLLPGAGFSIRPGNRGHPHIPRRNLRRQHRRRGSGHAAGRRTDRLGDQPYPEPGFPAGQSTGIFDPPDARPDHVQDPHPGNSQPVGDSLPGERGTQRRECVCDWRPASAAPMNWIWGSPATDGMWGLEASDFPEDVELQGGTQEDQSDYRHGSHRFRFSRPCTPAGHAGGPAVHVVTRWDDQVHSRRPRRDSRNAGKRA